MADLPPEMLAGLRTRLEQGLSGPWRVERSTISAHIHQVDGLHWLANCVIGAGEWHNPDESEGMKTARLIVAAVNALPALLDAAEREAAARKRVVELEAEMMAILQEEWPDEIGGSVADAARGYLKMIASLHGIAERALSPRTAQEQGDG